MLATAARFAGLAAGFACAVGVCAQESTSARAEPTVDRETGLVQAAGYELVKAQCTECHSASLIIQTRGRRDDWLGLIRWMQATQGLRGFAAADEAAILDYLEAHYARQERRHRRAPLPPELLPPPAEKAPSAPPS